MLARPSKAPLSSPIIAGMLPNERMSNRAVRPNGTEDWLLVFTLRGQGRVRVADGSFRGLARGDLLLFAPSTPQDYGYARHASDWWNIWVHFRPRPHWIGWMSWPLLSPGIGTLQASDTHAEIEAEMRRMIEVANGPGRLRLEAAMNALERVLILADPLNPRFGQTATDERIHKALVIVGERVSEPLDVESLGKEVGLSRSQFTLLFRRQMQVTPQAYIESVKLTRAAQMLQSSNWTVSQVSAANGFSSPYYFSTRFRKYFGTSPSAYRAAGAAGGSATPAPEGGAPGTAFARTSRPWTSSAGR